MNFKEFLLEGFDSDAYNFQDNNQEKLIHNGKWSALDFRHVLEGSGDIFREFCKSFADYSYVNEKVRRIERYLADSFNDYRIAKKSDSDLLQQLRRFWEQQPHTKDAQMVALNLNLALINGNWDKVKVFLKIIKDIPMGLKYTGEV